MSTAKIKIGAGEALEILWSLPCCSACLERARREMGRRYNPRAGAPYMPDLRNVAVAVVARRRCVRGLCRDCYRALPTSQRSRRHMRTSYLPMPHAAVEKRLAKIVRAAWTRQ